MGRASKNSWARMKGTVDESGMLVLDINCVG